MKRHNGGIYGGAVRPLILYLCTFVFTARPVMKRYQSERRTYETGKVLPKSGGRGMLCRWHFHAQGQPILVNPFWCTLLGPPEASWGLLRPPGAA